MNKKLVSLMLVSSLSVVGVLTPNLAEAQTTKNTYRCITRNGKPTTVVETKRGKIELIVWESKFFGNSGWPPQKRCQAVTQRFQQFSDSGTLRLITSGKMNNQPVICVGENKAGQGVICKSKGLLMTLQPQDNPKKVMEDLFDISARVSGGGIQRGDNETTINIEVFLDQAPLMENTTIDESMTEGNNISPKQIEQAPCPPLLCG